MSHVTIDDIDPRISYSVGSSSRTAFAVPFTYFENSDLVVTVDGSTLVLDTDYSVAGDGDTTGGFATGTVTLTVAVTDAEVVIARAVPVERTTDFPNSGPLSISALNSQFDKIIAMLQELNLEDSDLTTAIADAAALFATLSSASTSATQFATRGAVVLATVAASVSFIRTAGYTEEGDGGGALYKRVATEPSHPGKVQSADGAWFELAEAEIDVKMLGGKCDSTDVADGTDDTTAWDNLRQVVEATGKPFVWDGISTINSNTALIFGADAVGRGRGQTSVLRAKDSSLLTNLFGAASGMRLDLSDCVVDGNLDNDGTATTNSNLIALQGPLSRLHNVEVRNGNSLGIVLVSPADDVEIINAHVHHNRSGGLYTQGSTPPERLRVIGGTWWDNYDHDTIGDSNAINIHAASVQILGGHYKNNLNIGGGQIAVSDNADGTGVIDTQIIGVVVEQDATITGENTGGIEVNGSGVTVSSCRIINAKADGIRIEGDSSNVSVLGNAVSSTGSNGIQTISSGGVVGPRKLLIQGNKISAVGVGGVAISLQNVSTTGNDIVIDGNDIASTITRFDSGKQNASRITGNDNPDSDYRLEGPSPKMRFDIQAAGEPAQIVSSVATANRWALDLGDGGAETGADAGSDFRVENYNDAGTNIGTALLISRANGAMHFPQIGTTASAANAFLNSADSHNLLRSTSSLAYKRDVQPLDGELALRILAQLQPIRYRSKAPADNPDWTFFGLLAEDVAAIDPRLVHWAYRDEDYELIDHGPDKRPERRLKPGAKLVPDGVMYDRIGGVLNTLAIQMLMDEIAELKRRRH